MENTKFTVDYFIEKFEGIPEQLWCTNSRATGEQRCALGWCYPTKKDAKRSESAWMVYESDEDKALVKLVELLNPAYGVGGVNNGLYEQYQQPTPKQRILAALYDIKKLSSEPTVQECDAGDDDSSTSAWPNITKELAQFPVSETSDIKPVKETI